MNFYDHGRQDSHDGDGDDRGRASQRECKELNLSVATSVIFESVCTCTRSYTPASCFTKPLRVMITMKEDDNDNDNRPLLSVL